MYLASRTPNAPFLSSPLPNTQLLTLTPEQPASEETLHSCPLCSLLWCRNQHPHQQLSAARTHLGRAGVLVGSFSISELESQSHGRW